MAGRPTSYTEELADSIAERLITRSLSEICEQDEDVPHRCTVQRWIMQHDEFATKCARARELHSEYLIEQAEVTARLCEEDSAQSAKVKISFAQWYASKLKPKVYGDRISQEHSGPEGGPIKAEISVKFVRPEE